VLFLLISRKFNTPCFLAIVATLELSAMGARLLPDKEPPFLFPLAHEYRKFVENRIYWSIVILGGWRNGVRHQLAAK
jgi:hypothetical protein